MKKRTKIVTALVLLPVVLVVVLVVVLAVGLVALGPTFRQTLTMALLNQYLRVHNIHLSCLRFEVNWHLDIDVERLCIEHPAFTLAASNVNWLRDLNQLSADFVAVTYGDTKNTAPMQPVVLNIPDNLPLLTIKHVEIHSAFTQRPLVLSIRQHSRRQIEISSASGGLARLELVDQRVSGQIEWTLHDLQAWGLPLPLEGFANKALNAPITTTFSFDGQIVSSQSLLSLERELEFEGCPIHISGAGEVKLQADLLAGEGLLDLHGFIVHGQWRDCPLLQKIPDVFRFDTLGLDFSDPIKLTQSSLNTIGVQVTGVQVTGVQVTEVKATGVEAAGEKLKGESGSDLVLQLDNVVYQFNGEASADFQLTVKRGSDLSLAASGAVGVAGQGLSLNTDGSLKMRRLDYRGFSGKDLKSDFALAYRPEAGLQGQGTASLKIAQRQQLKIVGLEAKLNLAGANVDQLKFEFDSKLRSLTHNDTRFEKLTSQAEFAVTEQNIVSGTGRSTIEDIYLAKKPLGAVSVAHRINGNISKQSTSSAHVITVGKNFIINLEATDSQVKLNIDRQPISRLDGLITALLPELTVQSGQVSVSVDGDFDTLKGRGKISVVDANGVFDDMQFNGLQYNPQIIIDADGFALRPTDLTVKLVDVGVLLENSTAIIDGKNSNLQAYDIKGNVLGGKYNLNKFWLDGRDQQASLALHNIDLALLVALEKQSGIEVAGHLSGKLPVRLSGGELSIENGYLGSKQEGSLRINNNAAFETLKAQQPKVANQLALLEQLDFEKLDCTVNMTNTGMLDLGIAIVGFNSIANERINFNYSHQENVLVLLKALRLTDVITKQIEQRLH